jgi:flavin-binding protein dodecin
MENSVYKQIQLVGTSTKSIEDAINAAVNTASKTIRNLEWFRITDSRGKITDGAISEYQVILELGFKID